MCEMCEKPVLNSPPTPYRPVSPPPSPNLPRPPPSNSLYFFPTIQSQQDNSNNILGQDVLLNQHPVSTAHSSIPQSSPVLNTIHPSSHHLYHHHASLNSTPAAIQDSPRLSDNASPSIAFSTLSLRTPLHRPLPTFLPPAPRTSGPPSSTSPTVPTTQKSFSSLRANYSKMLGRKTSVSAKGASKASTSASAAMPPPPAPVRPTSTSMGDFSELEALIQQGDYNTLFVPPHLCYICDRSGGAGASLRDEESTRLESHVDLHLHRPPCTAPGTFPNILADRSFSLAYVSPDMTMADSAVFGFGGSASAVHQSSTTNTNAAQGTPIIGTGNSLLSPGGVGSVDPDFDNLLSAWMSPSTQNLPTPLSSFSTSPALYSSPFSDHLSTPAVDPVASFTNPGLSPDIVSASPAQPTFNLFDDLDSATSQSLFELMAHATAAQQLAASGKSTSPVAHHNGSATVKPTDLGLQLATGVTRRASWENASSASSSLSPQSFDSRNLPTSPVSSTGAARGDSNAQKPNGVRKNVQVRDLIPLDAPIQSRNYITPSVTSRKDVPPSVARTFVPNSRKRSAQAAGLP
ncbi:hypothetical protein FRB90_006895, partial [Tulasnella sp. 427]